MAVVDILEGFTGVVAGGDWRQKNAVRIFTLTTGSAADGPLFAWPITAGDTIPAPGTAHPGNANYYSGVPQVTRRGPMFWDVRVPYETPDPSGNQYQDPLDMPAEIEWRSNRRTVPYDKDLDNHETVNTLPGEFAEPINPSPTREISDIVFILTRNQAAFAGSIKAYQDTICNETFYGWAVGRSRMVDIGTRTVHTDAEDYYQCRYEAHIRYNTPTDVLAAKAWWKSLLNTGMNYIHTDGTLQKSETGQPVKLAADGKRILTGPAHWLYFREYFNATWAALGLE
jgi:hypothetical protein